MKVRHVAAALGALLIATPALAEKLSFDYRLYPPLKAALDSNRPELVESDQSNPHYLFNRIAVQGRSAADWSEAIEIVSRSRARGMIETKDWVRELRNRVPANCASDFKTINEDATSITFERHSTGCGPTIAETGIYRIVMGRTSMFLLGALYKGTMTEQAHKQWLDLMASAHLAS